MAETGTHDEPISLERDRNDFRDKCDTSPNDSDELV